MIKQYRTAVALEAVWQVWHTNLKFGHTNLMKFGQSILTKIIKIGGTRCQILRLKCPKSISAGALPQTPLGELIALPQTL